MYIFHVPEPWTRHASVHVFFTLKESVPIDWHYMTDRLQRFELKLFVCVLEKKQSPTS